MGSAARTLTVPKNVENVFVEKSPLLSDADMDMTSKPKSSNSANLQDEVKEAS